MSKEAEFPEGPRLPPRPRIEGLDPPAFDLHGTGSEDDLASVLNRLTGDDPARQKERAERNAAIERSIAIAQAGLKQLWELSNQKPLTAEHIGPILGTLSNIVATLCKQNHYLLQTVMKLEDADDRRR